MLRRGVLLLFAVFTLMASGCAGGGSASSSSGASAGTTSAGGTSSGGTTPSVPIRPSGGPPPTAPPLSSGVGSSVFDAAAFLLRAQGVDPNSVDGSRVSIVRGRVLTNSDSLAGKTVQKVLGAVAPRTVQEARSALSKTTGATPLGGVTVTIEGHPELGHTTTANDGTFSLAVLGGVSVSVQMSAPGFPSVLRSAPVQWAQWHVLPDVVLTPYDPNVTKIDFSAPVQVARGSVVVDADGSRQATLFFRQGTQAAMVLPNGERQALPVLHVRATEFTAGANGPNAMPQDLPPTSAYTYCAEFSADEAVAAGASRVTFSQPVVCYVENFLRFPIGTRVPIGSLDRQSGGWGASSNGRVIKILSIGGDAAIDVDGSGKPADPSALQTLGVDSAELRTLASLYPAGQELWRTTTTHFSEQDFNWGWAIGAARLASNLFPPGPSSSGVKSTDDGSNKDTTCKKCPASIIDIENQTLGEDVALTGTPIGLHYQSDGVPGRARAFTLSLPVSASTLPPGLKRIDVETQIAGRTFLQSLPAAPGQVFTFTWDGKDAFGRVLSGPQLAEVRIGYVYDRLYSASDSEASFGMPSATGLTVAGRQEVTLIRPVSQLLGVSTFQLGGWNLDLQHSYDPQSQTLNYGDGRRRSGILAQLRGRAFGSLPGTLKAIPLDTTGVRDNATDLCVGADGSLYVADSAASLVRRVDRSGVVTTVAGGGNGDIDGVPATEADLFDLSSVVATADGSLYIAAHNVVRRVGPDGVIRTVAGVPTGHTQGPATLIPDGSSATQFAFRAHVVCEAVAPDGSFYVGVSTGAAGSVVYKVDVGGLIHRFAGGGASLADNVPATEAQLGSGFYSPVARLAPDGTLYVTDQNGRVRRIGADGIITTVAGASPGSPAAPFDGVPATEAALNAVDVAVLSDGSFYVCDNGAVRSETNRIRYVNRDGIISTAAGSLTASGRPTGGAPATDVSLGFPSSAVFAPDGNLYFSDRSNGIFRLSVPLPGFDPKAGTTTIASDDGSEIYRFDVNGRHLTTVNSLTGGTLWTFAYNADGRVVSATDGSGNVTTLQRDGSGNVSSVVAPGGQTTTLTYDGNGYLASVADPAGNTRRFTYSSGGLLQGQTDPEGHVSSYTYDDAGLLVKDEDAARGSTTLERTLTANGWQVSTTTAMGRTATYLTELLPDGSQRETNIDAAGGKEVTVTQPDRSFVKRTPDGTLLSVAFGPDPRFGFQSPLQTSSVVQTPNLLKRSSTLTRSVTQSDPADPLTLKSLVDKVIVNGRTYMSTFTASNNTFAQLSPMGRQSSVTVDAQGRPTSIQDDPAITPLSVTYNSKGLPSVVAQGPLSLTYTYDAANRPISVVDALGRQVSSAYDAADRVVSNTLASGRKYLFAYDKNDNLTALTNPANVAQGQTFSPVDLLAGFVLPDGGSYSFSYDLDRAPQTATLPDGRSKTASYDSGARFIGQSYPEGQTAGTYSDTTDRLATLTLTPTGGDAQSLTFSYDGPLVTRMASGGPTSCDLRYIYDNNFFLTSITEVGVPFNVARDNDGLATSFGPFSFGRAGPSGAISSIIDVGTANAIQPLAATYTYDALGRTASRDYHTAVGTAIYRITQSYDGAGRIAKKTEVTGGASHNYTYTYDPDGQLTQVQKDGAVFESYTYDAKGNRLSRTVGPNPVEAATYDNQDRLLTRGSVVYTSDAAGFVVKRGTDTFTYSTYGELTSATVGGQTVTYGYDANHQMVTRTQNGNKFEIFYGGTSLGSRILSSFDQGTNTTSIYFYDSNGCLFAVQRGPSMFYIGCDQVGTPKIVVDSNGNVVREIDYDSWGNMLSDSNAGFYLPVGFARGLPDVTTGLVRFGARDYDPAAGRWIARDPILLGGGQTNMYAYVGNNPVRFTDHSGRLFGFDTGESYGQAALEEYAAHSIDPSRSVLDRTGAVVGGLFAALWTPCTSQQTFTVLSTAASLGTGGGLFTKNLTRYSNAGNRTGNWLTSGPPMNFSEAKDALQLPKLPNLATPTEVPWWEPVAGPRIVQGHPEWGTGGGIEFYRGQLSFPPDPVTSFMRVIMAH